MGLWKNLSAANLPAIILIFKNLGVWRDGLLCLLCFVLSVFWLRECGLFVVIVCYVLFWTYYWLRGFGLFYLIVCVIDCSDWLFFIERLWFCEEEEKYGRTVHCNAAVVNLCQKECGLIQTVDLLIWACIVCCENVFLFWTSFCERHKLNRLPNSDGYCSCVEENAAGCSVLF